MTTLTEPFRIMYHDVPSSPWLNTKEEEQSNLLATVCLFGFNKANPASKWAKTSHLFYQITHILFLLWCETQRSELLPVLSSPEEAGETHWLMQDGDPKTLTTFREQEMCYFLTELSCKFVIHLLWFLYSLKLIQPQPVSENVEMNYCHVSTEQRTFGCDWDS